MGVHRCIIGLAARVFTLLLCLLPKSFRQEYGEEMGTDFRRLIEDAYSHYGTPGVFFLLLGEVWDLLRAAIREHWQAILLQKEGPDLSSQLTPRVHVALRLAQEEARLVEDGCCKGGHVLIGLLREGGGIAAQTLRGLGVAVDPLRNRIAILAKASIRGNEPAQPTDNREQVLERAKVEAAQLGHHFVGTEHVLLGLLKNDAGFLDLAFSGIGVSSKQVQEATLSLINQGSANLDGVRREVGRAALWILKAVLLMALLLITAIAAVRFLV